MISYWFQAGAHVAFTVGDLMAADCSIEQAGNTVRHLLGQLAEAFGLDVAALNAETVLPRQLACLPHTALDRLRASYQPMDKVIAAGHKKRRAEAAPYV